MKTNTNVGVPATSRPEWKLYEKLLPLVLSFFTLTENLVLDTEN